MDNIAIRPLFGPHLTPEYFSLLNELSPKAAEKLRDCPRGALASVLSLFAVILFT